MKKVLIIGDTIIDEYFNGSVDRISPEAPIPVLDYQGNYKVVLGGACNVAANVRSLLKDVDIQIHYLGWVSPLVSELLTDINIASNINCEEKEILIKTRFVAGNHQILRVDFNKKYKSSPEFDFKLAENYDLIVFSDYNKATINKEFFIKIMQASKQECCFIIDFKKISNFDIENICRNSIFKSNKKEHDELSQTQKELLNSYWTDIITTMGKEGYAINNGENVDVSINSNVADVVGAGDTFLAGMIVHYLENNRFDVEDLAQFGNLCAGIKVRHFGTYAVPRAEVEKLKNEIL